MSFDCIACGSDRSTDFPKRDAKDGKPIAIAVCLDCGLAQLRDVPDDRALSEFYGQTYRKEYRGAATPKMRHVYRAGLAARDRLALIRPHLPAGASLLDIGAGGGEFVYLAGRAGLSASGIDPASDYLEFGVRNYAITLRGIEIAGLDPDEHYQAVTLFHVLEHLAHPRDALRRIAELLEPGGLLAVEVPNLGSRGSSPTNFWFKAHLAYYAPDSLQAVAEGLFDVIEIRAGKVIFALFRRRDELAAGGPACRPEVVAGSLARMRDKTLAEYLSHASPMALPRRIALALRTARETRGQEPRAVLDAIADAAGPTALPDAAA